MRWGFDLKMIVRCWKLYMVSIIADFDCFYWVGVSFFFIPDKQQRNMFDVNKNINIMLFIFSMAVAGCPEKKNIVSTYTYTYCAYSLICRKKCLSRCIRHGSRAWYGIYDIPHFSFSSNARRASEGRSPLKAKQEQKKLSLKRNTAPAPVSYASGQAFFSTDEWVGTILCVDFVFPTHTRILNQRCQQLERARDSSPSFRFNSTVAVGSTVVVNLGNSVAWLHELISLVLFSSDVDVSVSRSFNQTTTSSHQLF